MADPQHEPESQEPPNPSDLYLDSLDDEPGFARVNQMRCPLCSQSNPENHKYCGFCGVPLHAPLLTPQPRNSDFSPPSQEELHFLRKHNSESDGSQRDRRGWLYLVVGIAMLLAGFAAFERYYEPDSEPRAAAIPAAPVNEPPAPTPTAENQPPSSEPRTTPPEESQSSQASQKTAPLQTTEPAAARPLGSAVAGEVVPAARLSRSPAIADDGSTELAEARHELAATNPARNPVAAVSLLWKSVGKGNTQAEVTLADLFLKGEGVSRNCEQARLLLRTAAGKGSSAAATKLRTLQCK